MDILSDINLGGFRLINDLAGHNLWLDRFMIFAADKLGYLIILVVLFWAYQNSNRLKVLLLTIGSGILARVAFVELIRYFIYNPRPYLALEKVNILMNHEVSSSFPSGHATFYFAIAMGVYLCNKNPAPSNSADHQQKGGTWYGARAGWTCFALAGILGFARIFVSVHWPLDILAGAVLGIFTASIVKRFVSPKLSVLA